MSTNRNGAIQDVNGVQAPGGWSENGSDNIVAGGGLGLVSWAQQIDNGEEDNRTNYVTTLLRFDASAIELTGDGSQLFEKAISKVKKGQELIYQNVDKEALETQLRILLDTINKLLDQSIVN